jgi:hypothetical protein
MPEQSSPGMRVGFSNMALTQSGKAGSSRPKKAPISKPKVKNVDLFLWLQKDSVCPI